MKTGLSLGLGVFLALNPLHAATAQTTDWSLTFTVPFSATNLSSTVVRAGIWCSVKDGNGVQVGWGRAEVPIADGKYDGPPIEISIQKTGTSTPVSYLCEVNPLWDVNDAYCLPHPAELNPQYAFCGMNWHPEGTTVRRVEGNF